MAERKVLNKYFPPDFDPALVPRRKFDRTARHKVRLMAPFNMQCLTCGDYVYKGKKFLAGKEIATGEKYLDIQKYRFFIRCPMCAGEIVFKTDPENMDYELESGAQRNFEPWREKKNVEAFHKARREAEEADNPIKALENRTEDSQRIVDGLDALEDLREKKSLLGAIDEDEALRRRAELAERLAKQQEEADALEDEAAVKELFGADSVRRVDEADAPSTMPSEGLASHVEPPANTRPHAHAPKPKPKPASALDRLRRNIKKAPAPAPAPTMGSKPTGRQAKAAPAPVRTAASKISASAPTATATCTAALGGLAAYGSSSSSDSE